MVDNINLPSEQGENQPNKVTGEEHNKVQIKVNRQLDLLELIKMIEDEQDNLQRTEDDRRQGSTDI